MSRHRLLAACFGMGVAIGLTGCGIQVDTAGSNAKQAAEDNGSQVLVALTEAAAATRNPTALKRAIRTQKTQAYEEVESWAPEEFAEKHSDLLAAVYKTTAHKKTVTALAYASGSGQGGGLVANATVYGCFSTRLTPGSSDATTKSIPCPDLATSGSMEEITLTPASH